MTGGDEQTPKVGAQESSFYANLYDLLPGATPVGAYAMGMVCAATWSKFGRSVYPTRYALERARASKNMAEAEGFVLEWVKDLSHLLYGADEAPRRRGRPRKQ